MLRVLEFQKFSFFVTDLILFHMCRNSGATVISEADHNPTRNVIEFMRGQRIQLIHAVYNS